MKPLKPILLFAFLCIALGLQAQDVELIDSNQYEHVSYKTMVDSCLKNVNLDAVPYGILLEKAFAIQDIAGFSGDISTCDTAMHFAWRRAYGCIRRAFVDSTQAYDSLGVLLPLMQTELDSGRVPVSMLYYHYGRIKENAIDDSLLEQNGIELRDVPGRSESPFEEAACFIAAPAVDEVELDADSTVRFVFPESLITSNDTRSIDHLEVDFGDGEGYKTIPVDGSTDVYFGDQTDAVVKLRLHFTNNTHVDGKFNLKIVGYAGFTPDTFFTVTSFATYGGAYHGARVSIRYGCGNNDKKLRKPFIITEGFNGPKNKFYETTRKNGNGYLNDQNKGLYKIGHDLMVQIERLGYDIVFVDFDTNYTWLQANAYVVEAVLRRVNQLKWVNGSTHKNVLVGPSMGGVVCRYALAHMKTLEAANPGNADYVHDTKLFISHDAPLLGANQPLGLQALKMHAYKTIFEDHKLVIDPREFEDIYWDYLDLLCPAARQMLIYQYNYASSLYGSFYTEMNDLNGGDIGCKAVAISNGSGSGIKQKDVTNTITLGEGTLMWHAYNYGKGVIRYADIYSMSNQTIGSVLYNGLFVNYVSGKSLYKSSWLVKTAVACLPVDNAPGGINPISGGAIDAFIAPVVSFGNYGFIPTKSSLAVYNQGYLYNINSNTSESPFMAFISPDQTTPSGGIYNQFHAAFTSGNTKIFEHMLQYIPATIPAGYSYNFADTSGDRLASVEVEGILAVNNGINTGYTAQLTDHIPPNNTYYATQTFRVNSSCVGSAPEITIKDEGQLIIGDNSSNRTGELIITDGSTLRLESGSALRIHKNSTLIIENGAELIIEPDVTIELTDDASVLHIGGQLILTGNNNHLVISGQSGFVRFAFPSNGLSNITTTGSNASIEIEGSGMNDKVVEVVSGTVYPSDLGLFKIHTGTVELAAGTGFKLENSVDFYGVKFTGTSYAYPHNGILLTGQANTETINIEKCVFQFTNTAIKKESSSDVDMLFLNEVVFNNCAVGVHTISHSANLYNARFIDCLTGWKGEDMNNLSEFKGWCTGAGETGIDFSGTSGSELFVYSSRFKDQDLALSVDGASVAYIKCSTFENNDVSIHSSGGSFIAMSPNQTTTRLNSSTGYGSDNLFDDNTRDLEFYQSVGFDLEDGNNSFIYSSAPPSPAFYGSVAISSTTVDGNYWDYYSTYFTLTSYNVWNIISLSTVGYGTPSDLTTQPSNCTNWDGTIDGIISGESYSMVMPNSDKSKGVKADNNEQKKVTLYPNPTDKVLYVKCGTSNGNYSLKAVDITGRIIYLRPSSINSNTQSFDVSNLAAGLYQVIIEQNGVILAKQKLVVR